MEPMRGNDEQRLDALFRAYRDACPDPEASANFMPNLWQRIDARQSYMFSLRRMANAFVTAALALSLGLGVYMSIPRSTTYSSESYIEALAEANPLETPEILGPVHLEISDPGR